MPGIDTRALTALIRERGAQNAVIAHDPNGNFDLDALKARAANWCGLENLDLAKDVTIGQSLVWKELPWTLQDGYGEQDAPQYHVVALDFGVKRNILRLLTGLGAKVTVLPATATAEDVLAHNPDGVFLSNGPAIRRQRANMPCRPSASWWKPAFPFSASASATRCWRWRSADARKRCIRGHHGANHPVKDYTTGKSGNRLDESRFRS